jgi:hypothetical protein
MHHSLRGGSTRVSTHGQCRPWSKSTRKHVMFRWQPNVGFGQSKITPHKTWTLKLTTHQNISSFSKQPKHMFQCLRNLSLRNISPPKHVTFWELGLGPMHLSFMFPHVIPIHDVLDLFQLSHVSFNFCWIILLKKLMKIME